MKEFVHPREWTKKQKQASDALIRKHKTVRHLITPHLLPVYNMWHSGKRVTGLYCSRKQGKSYTDVLLANESCWQSKKINRFILPSMKQAKDVVPNIMEEIREYVPPDMMPKWRPSDGKFVYPNGSQLILGGCNDINAVRSNRGPISHDVFFDECGFYNEAFFWQLLKGAIFPQQSTTRGRRLFSTTPPESPAHPFVDEMTGIMPRLRDSGQLVTVTLWENSLLSQQQKQEILDEDYGGDPNDLEYRREQMCELVANQDRRILPEFDENIHVFSPEEIWEGEEDYKGDLPLSVRRHVGGDVGGVDKTAAILAVFNPNSGNVLVLEESELSNPDISEIARTVIDMREKDIHNTVLAEDPVIVIDVEPVSRNELRNKHGIDTRKPSKSTKAKTDRIRLLRTLLKDRAVKVSSNCQKLIKQSLYALWKESTTAVQDFERTKEFGHADLIDSLAYLVKSVDFKWNGGYTTKRLNLGRRKR